MVIAADNFNKALTKKIIIFLSFFAWTSLIGQVEKIKIKKETTCNYKIQIDPKSKGQELTIGAINTSGLSSDDRSFFFNNTMFVLGSKINVTHDNIEVMIQNICKIENRVLKKVQIKRVAKDAFIDFIYSDPK